MPEDVLKGINDSIEPVRREIDWFNGLSPLDQVRVLQRAFGGP
ncbi:hypothetical protein [Thalassospira sp. TSL5-1]|nr:hypothetical protein [Thalassospira sp. TSL5-1]